MVNQMSEPGLTPSPSELADFQCWTHNCPAEESIARGTVAGWRIWTTDASDPAWLSPPIVATDLKLTSRAATAWCPLGHQPPALGCGCGMWAVGSVIDVLFRLRLMAVGIRSDSTFNGVLHRASRRAPSRS